MTDQAPLAFKQRSQVDAAGAAVTVQTVVCEAPFDGVITRVAYVPSTTITGTNTTSRTLTCTNRGQTGAGTTVAATLALVSGVNAPADDAKALTLGVAANLVVAAGDVITFESTAVSTGIADPGGSVVVEFARS